MERRIPRCRSEQTWVQSLAVVASDAPWLHTTRTQPWWSTCPTPSPSYATWRAGSGTTPAHTSTALHAYLTVRRGAGDRKAEDAAGVQETRGNGRGRKGRAVTTSTFQLDLHIGWYRHLARILRIYAADYAKIWIWGLYPPRCADQDQIRHVRHRRVSFPGGNK